MSTERKMIMGWIKVSVATLWVKPRQARPVDKPSLAVPADPRTWVKAMSVAKFEP